MVLGSIPLSTFHDLFQSINLPASESLMLLRRDGTVLARHPDPVNRAGAKIPATSAWYAQVAQGGGHYDSTGIFDAQERIVALRLLRDYPLVMDVALSKDAALATWRRQAILISLGTIFGGVCLFLLLYALGRQFRRLEQQRAALQASEASVVSTSRELQTTLASMDQGLVMIDAGGTVVVCNPRAIELLELEPEQMAHRPRIDAVPPLRSLIDGVARQASTTQDGAALTDASHAPHVYERKLPGGQIIEVHAGRLASAGGWIATFADITARRHAEQQIVFAEAESRAKSGFLAMMSHEIRTPMNGVPGLAGALFDTQLTEQQARMVAAIHDSGNALLRILNDILDFSKLDAGQMQLEGSPFSVATLTQDPVSLLAPKAAAKGLTISTVCDDGLPAALLGDAGRLRQVLLNLVSNAIKFTQNGSVTVRAACPERDEHAATIVWTVTDTGIGIPPDHIAGLFGEFFQADASISRRFGGSGLGLAISKRLIEQMGGKIAVRSQPGMGSTFEVTLRLPITAPAHVEEAAPADVTATFETRLRRLGRPARILFAEDNQTNQFVALQLLKGFTVQVDVAGNGLEAVAAAAQTAYDVICMDMNMPDMDGLAATREIRALPGPIRLVPIIALTANAFPEDVRACRDAGMDLFLAKPVSKQGLVAALLRAIGDGVAPAGAAAPDAGCDPGCDKMALGALAEDIGGANVAELVNLFITETQARFRRIASLGADKAGLGQEIHALKGTAGTVFATRLAGCAAALDRRLRAGGSMEQAEFDALKSAFDSYLTEVGDVHRLQPSAA
jgi:signal transduction histidine kinase/HPt (histidine-containing phosphotransfer) domain-containing protein/ActR/RegA family two-component response regulator